ncbi:MAG: TIGR03089 family protein [Marmoricola sp.]
MVSFNTLLSARLRHDPGKPLITFYDDLSGERTELSVTTWANWVAKTAGVLVDDLDLMDGDHLAIDLPTHWLGTVFLGASWLMGATVDSEAPVRITAFGAAGDLVCSLHPFALPCPEPVAPALDFGHVWPNQPDVFLGVPSDADLLPDIPPSSARVMSDANPLSSTGVSQLIAALRGTGSLVIVANPDPSSLESRATTEHVDEVTWS